jgi:hypothetical protein
MKSPRFSIRIDRNNQISGNLDKSQPNSHYKLYQTLLATAVIAGSQLLAMMSATANPVPNPSEPVPNVPTRIILNGDFQQPTVSGYGIGVNKGYTNSGLPIIWQTTERGGQGHYSYVDQLEVWAQIEGGVSPKTNPDGNQFVELNSDTNASIYQDICVLAGETVTWSLKHAVRQDPGNIGTEDYVNTMRVSITDPTIWQDSKTPPSVKLYESPNLTTKSSEGWLTKTGTWTNPTTNGVPKLRFAFEAKQGSKLWGVEDKSVGNFIDDVRLNLSPVIDFLPTNGGNVNLTTTTEGNTTKYYYLSLRINGIMNNAGSVKIDLTGLTRSRQFRLGDVLKGSTTATGLSATKNGNHITLNIPAGTYDANVPANYIHIPIDFSNTTKQPNDNLTFTLSNSTGGGTTTSTNLAIGATSCGNTPRSVVNTQLTDDDYQNYQKRVQLPIHIAVK